MVFQSLSPVGRASAPLEPGEACPCAGREALGFLPDPLVSVHSLGALAERTNAHNMRVLDNLTEEGAFGPIHDGPPASSEQEAGSADSADVQEAAGKQGPAGHSESDARDGSTPQEQDDSLKRGSYRGDGMSASAAGDASSASHISSADAPRHGRKVTELPADDCSSPAEPRDSGRHKPSRLGAFFGRLRRRKPPSPLQSSPSSESDPPDVEPQSASQSTSDTLQHAESPGAQPLETAAAGQDMPSQVNFRVSKTQGGEHWSIDNSDAEQHAASTLVAPGALNGKEGSQTADAALPAQREHEFSSAAEDGSAPELPDMRVEWDMMNETMMHSVHTFVSTLSTILIAQVSTPSGAVHVGASFLHNSCSMQPRRMLCIRLACPGL